ncbi:MAG: glycoside hydrolase family 5 protein [Clostridiales bacterium]|nr:glycoside hydrolase family 5 protein [Clostridiales bacterium]
MLKVKNNKIYDGECEIRLLGVNRAGLEWDSRDTRIFESITQACDDWKANIIRLPVSQDRWFGYMQEQDDVNNADAYRAKVDKIVELLAARGKYLLLDLHWSDLGVWGKNSGQHMMPDENSIIFWQNAAARYCNHPNVLFGIYNEPHVDGEESPWKIWKYGGMLAEKGSESPRVEYRAVGMQEMIDVIRATGAKNIVVVGGLDWGYTFEGLANPEFELADPAGNGIILDAHVYPWKRLEWDLDVTIAADRYPILVGECGHYGNDADPVEGVQRLPAEEWVPRLLAWIDEHGYNLTAWDFHPKAGPCLIKSFDNEPTDHYGVYICDYLRSHNK